MKNSVALSKYFRYTNQWYAAKIANLEPIYKNKLVQSWLITPEDKSISQFEIWDGLRHNYQPSVGAYWMKNIRNTGDWCWTSSMFENEFILYSDVLIKNVDLVAPSLLNGLGMPLYQNIKPVYAMAVTFIKPGRAFHMSGIRYIVCPINNPDFEFEVIVTDHKHAIIGKSKYIYLADCGYRFHVFAGELSDFDKSYTSIENLEFIDPSKAKEYPDKFVQREQMPKVNQNNDVIAPETILCAATWFKDFEKSAHGPVNIEQGVVLCGYHHCDIIAQHNTLLSKSQFQMGKQQQGFLTNYKRFVGREEAAIIAYKAKQITELKKRLYSEDLYSPQT